MTKTASKTLLLLSLITLFSISSAYSQGDELRFSEEKTVAGLNAKELFLRAQNSINKSFNESNLQLLEVDEDGSTFISGKSMVSFSAKDAQLRTVASGSISFEFESEVSNGKVALTLFNWVHIPENSKYDFGQLTTDELCPYKVSGTMKKSRNNVWSDLKITAEETATMILENFSTSIEEGAGSNTSLSAQTKVQGVPEDLKEVGVIFLMHEMADLERGEGTTNSERLKYKMKEKHNQRVPKANESLTEAAAKFPYTYQIAKSRDELDDMLADGHKYVLDCLAYDNMKSGNYKSSAKIAYFYELYIKDLSTNTLYIITTDLAENSVYDFKTMINTHLLNAMD